MADIQIDFYKAQRQAAQLEAQADTLRNMADRMLQNVIDQLASQWKGESARAYLAKCYAMQERLRGTAKSLDFVASAIRRRARAIYEAEQAAKRIAQTRNGG